MKPAAFDYVRPATVAEALAALSEIGADSKIIAGGQSLVPSMNFRLARPEMLVDINGIEEIQGTKVSGDYLEIGALTRHAAFHTPVVKNPVGHLLSKVVKNIAHYPIRQRGTFGGSLCHADPASEWCLVAMTLGAQLEIGGQSGVRKVAVEDFFRGTFMTTIGEDEILLRIHLPLFDDNWGGGFHEFSRRKGDFALASALAMLKLGSGIVQDARLGLGAIAATAVRLTELEKQIVGRPATAETFAEIANAARDLVKPSSDIHGSAEYRRDLVGTLLKRALADAAGDCGSDAQQ